MSLKLLYRSILVALVAVLSMTACRGKAKDGAPEGASEAATAEDALTEQNEAAGLAFSVAPNGQVRLTVKGTSGNTLLNRGDASLHRKASVLL